MFRSSRSSGPMTRRWCWWSRSRGPPEPGQQPESGQVAVGGGARLEQFDVTLRGVHPRHQPVEIGRRTHLDTDECLTGLAVVALDVLEQCDVVIGTEHLVEEPPQRTGLLREVDQE